MFPEPFISRSKALLAKRSEKGFGDENGLNKGNLFLYFFLYFFLSLFYVFIYLFLFYFIMFVSDIIFNKPLTTSLSSLDQSILKMPATAE